MIARSANKRAAAMRRFGVSAGGRALAAIGSTGLSAKQKDRMKKEQAALKEYYKVGGDKMLKDISAKGGAAKKTATKKTMSKIAGQTLKTSAKVAGYGAQVVTRMMQNNVVMGTTGAMFDNIYDRP